MAGPPAWPTDAVDEDAPTSGWQSEMPLVDSGTMNVTPHDITPHGTGARQRGRLVGGSRASSLSRGASVGRYVVLDRLGSGGLGDVYASYDPELHRQVAIKVLRPAAAQTVEDRGMARLVREAQAMAQLQHPNVVAVYDVGRTSEGVFIAMEKVEGVTLSKWRKLPHPWRQVRDVFRQAGTGLAAAHDAGLMHRDFKPGNVIVSPDGRVRVLDFGLARGVWSPEADGLPMDRSQHLLDSRDSGDWDNPVTLPGMVMGTPQYMAPEQFFGGDLGPAVDQFSFCVAFWEALFGQRPFVARSVDELYEKISSEQLSEPKDPRGVPTWLRKVLRRGLSSDPARRWPSMRALLRAIDRDVRTRRRGWIGVVIASVLSAGVATGAAVILRPEPTQSERDRIDELTGEARAAAARSYFVYPPPGEPDYPTAFQAIERLEAIEGAPAEIAQDRSAELRAEFAATLVRLGDTYWEREGGVPFASDYYAASLVFVPDNEHARARTMLTPSELAALRDRASDASFGEAEIAAAESLAVLAEPDDDARAERLAAWFAGAAGPSASSLARLEGVIGEDAVDDAQNGSRRPDRRAGPGSAAAPGETAIPELPPDVEPEETAIEAGDGEEDRAPAASPQRAREFARQGVEAVSRGAFRQAETLFHQALSHDRKTVTAVAGLAELHFELGNYQQALKYAKKAVSIAPRRGRYRILLGDAHFKTLGYAQARIHYEKAKDLGHRDAAARLRQLDARLGR